MLLSCGCLKLCAYKSTNVRARRLALDHVRAKQLGAVLNKLDESFVPHVRGVTTNIVIFELGAAYNSQVSQELE